MRTIDITIAPDRKGRASGFLGGLTKERFVFRFDGDALPENCKLALFHANGTTLAVADCELVGNIGTAVLDTDTQQVVDALATYPVGQCAPVVLYIGSDSDIIAVVQAQLQKNWLDDGMVHPPAPLASYYTKAETQALLADYASATGAALEAEAAARRCDDARLCSALAGKQDKLTAGTGIHFCGNVICATGGGGGGGSVCFRSCVAFYQGDSRTSKAIVENANDHTRLTIKHSNTHLPGGDAINITTEKCSESDTFYVQGAVGAFFGCLDGNGAHGISLGRTDNSSFYGSFGGKSIQFLSDCQGKLKAVRAKNYWCDAESLCLPVPAGGCGGSAPGTAYGANYFQAGTPSKPFDGGNIIQFHSSDGTFLSGVSLLHPPPGGAIKNFYVKSVRGEGFVCTGGNCAPINVGYNNYAITCGDQSSIAFGKSLFANEAGMILFGGTTEGLCFGMAIAMFPKKQDSGGTGYLGFYRRWRNNNLDGVRISWDNWKAMLVAAGGVADSRQFFQR